MNMQLVINSLLIDLRNMLSAQRSCKKSLKSMTTDLSRKTTAESIKYLDGGINHAIFSLSLIRLNHGKLYLKKEFSHKENIQESKLNATN